MNYLSRIRAGKFSESDVLAFYIDKRFDCGPFIREVGDFVAHRVRTQGESFNVILGAYAQFAFFQRYQGTNKISIEPIGECDWWLKPFFMRKLQISSPRELQKVFRIRKDELKKQVESWFPKNESFPTRVVALNPFDFFDLAAFFSRELNFQAAFVRTDVTRELADQFKKLGIPSRYCDDFLVSTAVILNGREFDFSNGVGGTLALNVSKQRQTKVPGGDDELLKHGGFFATIHPDGPLELFVSTRTPKQHGLVDIGFMLLDTEIDTERYFSRDLVECEQHGPPRLNLNRLLKYESTDIPRVSRAD